MGSSIIAVVFLNESSMIVWFENGVSKRYTAQDLDIAEGKVFRSGHITNGGATLTWKGGGSMTAEDLYARGEKANFVEEEKHRLLKTLSGIRREASFSQTRLGEAAGIRQSVISRIEGCEISPQINTLLKLLAPLGKTLAIVDLEEK